MSELQTLIIFNFLNYFSKADINTPISGKNTFAKIVDGRKQQTYFCPALLACYAYLSFETSLLTLNASSLFLGINMTWLLPFLVISTTLCVTIIPYLVTSLEVLTLAALISDRLNLKDFLNVIG